MESSDGRGKESESLALQEAENAGIGLQLGFWGHGCVVSDLFVTGDALCSKLFPYSPLQ